MKYKLILVILFVFMQLVQTDVFQQEYNLTDWKAHRRQKRFLIFQDAGVLKFIFGFAVQSAEFPGKKVWRQLFELFNFQFQYAQPNRAIYWWNKFDNRKFSDNRASDVTPANETATVDEAQMFLYEFLIHYMDNKKMNGRDCLLRLICENAQVDAHHGVFSELLHRFLTPHKSLNERYLDAYKMGRHGVDCGKTFPDSPGYNFINTYLHHHDQHMGQSFSIR